MTNAAKSPRLWSIALSGVAAAFIGGAGLAMGQPDDIDGDGDGMVSYPELLTVVPTLTEEEFMALDADGDGLLNDEELSAAEDAGLIDTE